jgi:hypothetical protein
MRAVRNLSEHNAFTTSQQPQNEAIYESLISYCELENIATEEQQLCYNISTFYNELKRLLMLGVDDQRLCKKVHSMNPDFCKVISEGNMGNDRVDSKKFSQSRRGVIYI